jgi:tight adherence protein B
MEISFGLGIEEVFERFSKRVQLEEVTYLTASLSILNKTGGNIIKVFSSIEKTLFNKKKLKLELRSLTGSSKLIVYVLFAVPLLFILFISLVSPGYFSPFYTTGIGFLLLCIMLFIYILYIWFVSKIMKVRM